MDPKVVEWSHQATSLGITLLSQHQDTIALNCVYEHFVLSIDLFCAFISKMGPKAIASLFQAILAYKRFARGSLFSKSGETCIQLLG